MVLVAVVVVVVGVLAVVVGVVAAGWGVVAGWVVVVRGVGGGTTGPGAIRMDADEVAVADPFVFAARTETRRVEPMSPSVTEKFCSEAFEMVLQPAPPESQRCQLNENWGEPPDHEPMLAETVRLTTGSGETVGRSCSLAALE